MPRNRALRTADIRPLTSKNDGVVDRATLLDKGVSPRRLQRLADAGDLVRLAPGQYSDRRRWADADGWGSVSASILGVRRARTCVAFVSGWSTGTVVWQLPELGSPPALPEVVRSSTQARTPSVTPFGRFGWPTSDLRTPSSPVTNAWVGRDGPQFRVDKLWVWHGLVAEGDGERFQAGLARNPVREAPVRWWRDVDGVPVEPRPEDVPSPYPTGIVLPPGWDR